MSREIVAGITTFLTMAYIVVVNPAILSSPGTGIPFSGALTATVLVCFTMTLLMGVYARLPFGVAPGMGLNAFFTYTLIINGGVPWPVALGIIFWAGVVFLLVSITPLRERIAMAIPSSLRSATAAGIGLLLTFIGLQNSGFVAANPATMVGVGPLDHRALLTLVGLIVAVWLTLRNSPFAYLAAIALVTGIAWIAGYVTPPASWFSAPDFSSVFLKLDIRGALKWSLAPAMVTVMLTDLFDSLSTFIGVSQAANLVDDKGEPKNLRRGLIVDSVATLGAGLFGSSSGTAYVESIAGIRMGGTTGLPRWSPFCFLPCLFIAPIAGDSVCDIRGLILVGVSMFRP
jgi:AGZA family xanthine/uracil permease-like MFS transporter